MGRPRKTVARTGAGENGIRAILQRNRKHELDPWRIPGGEPDEFESALEAGEAVVVDSATLWIAFGRVSRTPILRATSSAAGLIPASGSSRRPAK